MSVRLTSDALDSGLPLSQKMVLLILCDFADDLGKNCYPSIATIADKASLSERQTQRVMSELMADALIGTSGKFVHGGRGLSRRYQINIQKLSDIAKLVRQNRAQEQEKGDTMSPFSVVDKSVSDAPKRVTSTTERVTSEAERVTSTTEKGDTHVTLSTNIHQQKHPLGDNARTDGTPVDNLPSCPPPENPDADFLKPFPVDWQPDETCKKILSARNKPMPAQWVVDAFVAHWADKLLAPRRIPNEFLKWVCRQQGMNRGRVPVESDGEDVKQIAASAWEQVRTANQRSEMPKEGWKDARTTQALIEIGGFGALRDMRIDQVPFKQKEFISAFVNLGRSQHAQ